MKLLRNRNNQSLEKQLRERIKELNGLYALGLLTEKYDKLEDIYDEFLNTILPESMQFSDKVYALLEIENQKYSNNSHYRLLSDKNCLISKIKLFNKEAGKLIVAYTEDLSFLTGFEQKLIDAYAQKISKITERMKTEQKAEESDKLKTEFINNMSHEIRTPMNGILGFSKLLQKKGKSEEERNNYINIIQNCGNQLMRIIDDILEISKLGTKQITITEKQICLNDFLLNLFSIFDIKAKENKTPLYLKRGLSNDKSIILTDEVKLNKILSNLIENALKFTNSGFIEYGYHQENSILKFYVKDTGIGIKPGKQGTIFERFSQEEKELSKNVGGLGLGLSIAKENAELLGGKITLNSEKGKGATFFVTIPYKPVNTEIDNSENYLTIEKQDKCTILIVEDEEVNYLYLEMLLEDEIEINCRILHAKHGKEAVEMCKENPEIDFILMDLKMPIMNGFEATKLIKEFKPDLPIVAQTAYTTREDKKKAFSAGCDDFISKPINEETLNEIMNKYLITK
jgi:signal transduction histidine kinase/ActR/RegA family two-component response regulator